MSNVYVNRPALVIILIILGVITTVLLFFPQEYYRGLFRIFGGLMEQSSDKLRAMKQVLEQRPEQFGAKFEREVFLTQLIGLVALLMFSCILLILWLS